MPNNPFPTSSFQGNNDDSDTVAKNLKELLHDANDLKSEGNDHFRAKRWVEALVAYRSALSRFSETEGGRGTSDNNDDADGEEVAKKDESQASNADEDKDTLPKTELEQEYIKMRSALNANVAACCIQLGDYKEAVNACTRALRDDPQYVKALQRRAAANEKINTWSSLTSANEDYTALLKMLPSSSPQIQETKRTLGLLKPRIEAAQKHETAEMLDKLKGLGNSILGNFGLSTDNFKFEPNGQGGYSMNFSQ